MTRNGIVVALEGDTATVSLTGSAGCGSCEARHACFSLSPGSGKEVTCRVANATGVSVGDVVVLELAPAASLKAILATFLLPVLTLVAGYLLTSGGGDARGAAGAGAGLLVGIALAVLVNRRLTGRGETSLRIVG